MQKSLEALYLKWAKMIEKRWNANGVRLQPVTLSTGVVRATNTEKYADFMDRFIENDLEPEDYYEIFERLHPFNDGNGRVGDLLWKISMVRKTGNGQKNYHRK